MIIGITGGSGCGKTTLLNEIRQLGGAVYDCDAIYHALLESDTQLLDAIRHHFPASFDGESFSRKRLGKIVFENSEYLKLLNEITHRAVYREVVRRLSFGPELAAIDAIALFESGLSGLCDTTVAVTAPEEDRIQRLMTRDSITREYALSRIRAQHDPQWFTQRCDHTLDNNGSCEDFQKKCLDFLRELKIVSE